MYSLNLLEMALVLATLRPHLRGRRHEVLRALRGDRHRHERTGSLGRRRRLLLRQLASRRRHAHPDPGAFDRRAHPALRGNHARRRHTATASRFCRAVAPVHQAQAALSPPRCRSRSRTTQRESRLLAIVDPERLRRILEYVLDESRVPQRPRPARAVEISRRASARHRPRRRGRAARLRAGRIDVATLRRQLELAWAGLVSGQPPDHRGAARLPPLSRRHVDRRVSARVRDGRRTSAPSPTISRRGLRRSSSSRSTAVVRWWPASSCTHAPISQTPSRSTSTFTPRPGRGSARRIRPAGPGWSRICCCARTGGARSLRHRGAPGASGYTRLTNGGRTPGSRHPRSRGDAAHRRCGTIDGDGIGAVVDFYVTAGLDGILALGTTGEGILFSLDERRLRPTSSWPRRITGSRSWCTAARRPRTTRSSLAEHAAAHGAAGVAVIPPPYFALDAEAIWRHLDAAAHACAPLPFYIYEFAARSGYAVPIEVIERLRSSAPNLAGLKVSDSPFETCQPYLIPGLDVFIGAEGLIAQGMASGAAGAVSGLAAALPELTIDAVASRSAGGERARGARAVDDRTVPVPVRAEVHPATARRRDRGRGAARRCGPSTTRSVDAVRARDSTIRPEEIAGAASRRLEHRGFDCASGLGESLQPQRMQVEGRAARRR